MQDLAQSSMVFEDALLSASSKSTSANQGEPAIDHDNQAVVMTKAPNVESSPGMEMVAKLSQEPGDYQASLH